MKKNYENELKLHEAIVRLLKEKKQPMTCREIADALNKKSWYERGDNGPLPSNQISARIKRKTYQHLFKVNRGTRPMEIGLPEWK
jgi:hypothetical protein